MGDYALSATKNLVVVGAESAYLAGLPRITFGLCEPLPIAAAEMGPAASGLFVYISAYRPLIRIFRLDMASGALAPTRRSERRMTPP
jgi:hypothetical protein